MAERSKSILVDPVHRGNEGICVLGGEGQGELE